MARTGRAVSVSNGTKADRHASISTVATRRRSKGWWNYITTPFLTRSNTFATREPGAQEVPALPDLAIAVAKAQIAERDLKKWEKEFSPLTPKTSTTVASDQWWDLDAKKSEQSPVVRDTRHKVQTSTGTLPIVLSETAGFGAATMSSIASHDTDQLSRENTSSSFGCAGEPESLDREVPILDDAPGTRSLRSNNPFVQPTVSNISGASQRSQPESRGAVNLPRLSSGYGKRPSCIFPVSRRPSTILTITRSSEIQSYSSPRTCSRRPISCLPRSSLSWTTTSNVIRRRHPDV